MNREIALTRRTPRTPRTVTPTVTHSGGQTTSEPAGIEQYFTPAEAARILALSVPTIRRLERDGEMRGVRLAGRLRFAASALSEYVAACANVPRRTPPPGLLAAGGRPRGRRRR